MGRSLVDLGEAGRDVAAAGMSGAARRRRGCCPPWAFTVSMASSMVATAPASTSGPMRVSSSSGSPMRVLRVERQEPRDEGLVDGLVDDDPAGGGAALAGGADGAEVDGLEGDVQVGLVADDDGVVAAQLQDELAEALLHQLAHVAAAGHGAGVGDQGHARVGVDEVADVAAPADDEAADGRVEAELRAGPARRSCVQAMAVSGVLVEGFQSTVSPQTRARAVFQLQTATGKLKAVMTPTTPSGCHCSCSRCWRRSLGMVRP